MANSTRVLGIFDRPMWESIEKHHMALQKCLDCGTVLYPPAPVCPHCLSLRLEWRPVSGRGKIMSWVVFHRQYFDDFPPPYNAVTVRLEEGPIIVSNFVGPEPEGSWIDADVVLDYVEHGDRTQHVVRLAP